MGCCNSVFYGQRVLCICGDFEISFPPCNEILNPQGRGEDDVTNQKAQVKLTSLGFLSPGVEAGVAETLGITLLAF